MKAHFAERFAQQGLALSLELTNSARPALSSTTICMRASRRNNPCCPPTPFDRWPGDCTMPARAAPSCGISRWSIRDMTIEDGYAIQSEWVRLEIADGRSIKGRKIGLTSRAMQQASQITEPDYAPLMDDMFFATGSDIPFERFIAPRVEVELAFVLRAPLQGSGRDDFRRAAGHRLRDSRSGDHRCAHRAIRPRHARRRARCSTPSPISPPMRASSSAAVPVKARCRRSALGRRAAVQERRDRGDRARGGRAESSRRPASRGSPTRSRPTARA